MRLFSVDGFTIFYAMLCEITSRSAIDQRVRHNGSRDYNLAYCLQYHAACKAYDLCGMSSFIFNAALSLRQVPGNVLDLGCGTGSGINCIQNALGNVSVTGLDHSSHMLDIARGSFTYSDGHNIDLINSDWRNAHILLRERKYSLIIWSFGLNYTKDANDAIQILRSLSSLLVPGGIIFLADLKQFKSARTKHRFWTAFDRKYGEFYEAEVWDSYGAAYTHESFMNIASQSGMTGSTMTSWAFPLLQTACLGRTLPRNFRYRVLPQLRGQSPSHAIMRSLCHCFNCTNVVHDFSMR